MESLMLAAAEERNRLAGQLERSEARNSELLERLNQYHQSEIDATRKVADFVAQTRYGRSVFDRVSEIPFPPQDELKPMPTERKQASQIVLDMEREFLKNLRQQHDSGYEAA